MLRIAIDGPAGSGKSTISKALSKKFNLTYIDTGAMYRACAYIALKYNLSGKDLINKIKQTDIVLKNKDGKEEVFIKANGFCEDITEQIRSVEVTKSVSKIAAIPEIRKILSEKQKKIAEKNNVIMDGRDIGTVIIPNAEIKIFLNANPETRALRRFNEINNKNISYEEILADIKKRDFDDANRDISPLIKAEDAIEIDTSEMSIEEVINQISSFVRRVL